MVIGVGVFLLCLLISIGLFKSWFGLRVLFELGVLVNFFMFCMCILMFWIFFLLRFCIVVGEFFVVLKEEDREDGEEREWFCGWGVEGFLFVVFKIELIWLILIFWLEGCGEIDIFLFDLLIFIFWLFGFEDGDCFNFGFWFVMWLVRLGDIVIFFFKLICVFICLEGFIVEDSFFIVWIVELDLWGVFFIGDFVVLEFGFWGGSLREVGGDELFNDCWCGWEGEFGLNLVERWGVVCDVEICFLVFELFKF